MVYGECRAMEFAFVRNGREETDREKIRAFAEAYGLVLCGELAGANVGRLWLEKTAARRGADDAVSVFEKERERGTGCRGCRGNWRNRSGEKRRKRERGTGRRSGEKRRGQCRNEARRGSRGVEGTGRGENGLQANKAIYDRNRT